MIDRSRASKRSWVSGLVDPFICSHSRCGTLAIERAGAWMTGWRCFSIENYSVLEDGRTLRIYTENLTLYHVAKMYNKYVPEHVPPIPWYTRYFEAKRIDNARKEARKWKPKWWKR